MAGLLDGQLADAIYRGFKNKLLTGTLRRMSFARAEGLDERGDPNLRTPTDYPCQGFTDEYSEFFRATAGVPDTDLKVCVFGKSLPDGVRPQKDDYVRFRGTWHQVRTVSVDPANALWECRASRLQAENDDCRARGI